MSSPNSSPHAGYELCFRPLSHTSQGYSFPCDANGQVNLDAMSEPTRNAYFFARVVIGHQLAAPEVIRAGAAPCNTVHAAPAGRFTAAA